MKNEANAEPENLQKPPASTTPDDPMEKRLPIAEGGYGPLDSDDIEWLIETGNRWMPG